jgi:2-polyprenyl-3-methyl-5-hydroxy-6-metoxy-1,4-benzoquinol methylase
MSNIKIGDSRAFSKVLIPDVATTMPGSYMQPHIIHPTTLDALNQLAAVIFKEQCSNAPVMPVFMDEVTVSADISNTPGTELLVALQLTTEGLRSCKGDTWVLQVSEEGEHPRPVVTASGWQLRAIGEAPSNEDLAPFHKKMSYKMDWPLDVDFMTNEVFHYRIAEAKLFDVPAHNGGTSAEIEVPLNEKAAAIYIRGALRRLDAGDDEVTSPHLIKLLEWMREHIESETACQHLRGVSHDDEETISQHSIKAGIVGEALYHIGISLPEILVGKADPLAVLLQNNLLHKLYAESLAVSSSLQLAQYVKLLACKKPRMNFLEIGAGTGGATLPLLQALTGPEGLLLDRYHYTDISSGFFQQARTKFSEWDDHLDFQILDISKDPLEQGYSAASYDLVVASNVLHATPILDTTLANIKKILKPGGRLALIEVTRVTAAVNTIFGTLPG